MLLPKQPEDNSPQGDNDGDVENRAVEKARREGADDPEVECLKTDKQTDYLPEFQVCDTGEKADQEQVDEQGDRDKGLSINNSIVLRRISFRIQGAERGAYSLYVTLSATQKTEG